MKHMRRRSASAHALILLAGLTFIPGMPYAQDGSARTPDNATVNASGTSWVCDPGYQRANGLCTKIELPQNAFLTTVAYGRGWDCERGFRAVDNNSCVAVEVPQGAYLEASGDRWKCERGYRRDAGGCMLIEVPANAYLDSSGGEWVCGRGYREDSDA